MTTFRPMGLPPNMGGDFVPIGACSSDITDKKGSGALGLTGEAWRELRIRGRKNGLGLKTWISMPTFQLLLQKGGEVDSDALNLNLWFDSINL